MTPVRRNNQEWLPSIFSDFFDNDWMTRANTTTPTVNVIENETDYKVEVAAPDMTKDDVEKEHISAAVNDGVLTIDLPKKQKTQDQKV